ncbi:MAG: cation diffusion facilitator family transporter [Oscillospiraceae bacterium]|nr:cation diffusion facilitator family transporter [Oscillospiraceae bacterium]
MIHFLAKHLIKDHENISSPAVRRAYGILCGCVGIGLNLLLFGGKLLAGILSRSIAVTADAVNNLSDAGSSVVTLLGFKLAAQEPDQDHPFGHGRLEYISGLVVSMVILLMGVELGKTSLEKILHPEPVDFSPVVAVILCASILVKLYMVLYNRRIGKRIHSAAMAATAADSLSDCLATSAVLLGTLAGHFLDLHIDGWCGAAVALFILWSGFGAARETINPLLGQPPSPEFVEQIRSLVRAQPQIIGIHDLIVHDYGPGRRILSLHAEVPASGDILALHDVVDALEKQLNEKLGCLATIHMDPVVNDGGATTEARERVQAVVRVIDPGISIHDFRMVPGPTHTKLIFDAEVPYQCTLPDQEIRRRIQSAVQALDEAWSAVVEVEKSYV